ncbi:hypothetical protein GXY_12193 [Novacetimonas hansenii ATCC 23769]|uniref:Uncharacterized protein n=1 Tax=Novacetimonas hansenii ATCC 23769 TaxID=714995 RepID=D5QHH1_NOVHA|nr:hypothetical protein GXY_12193 [Novacetimonas hansenii ATCC 23769]
MLKLFPKSFERRRLFEKSLFFINELFSNSLLSNPDMTCACFSRLGEGV